MTCRVCNTQRVVSQRRICRPCETWLLGGPIAREVANTEVWLELQAQLAGPSFPHVSGRVWASEIAKAAVWLIGLVLIIIAMVVLAPEARADSVPVAKVASYLDQNTVLPLATGVDISLATNLIDAQDLAWGKHWEKGSLLASENSVLKAISLYLWPGGPAFISSDQTLEPIVWLQSNIAIDVNLTVSFARTAMDFGTRDVVGTPEPGAFSLVGFAGALFGMCWWWRVGRRTMAERMTARLQAYRVRP